MTSLAESVRLRVEAERRSRALAQRLNEQRAKKALENVAHGATAIALGRAAQVTFRPVRPIGPRSLPKVIPEGRAVAALLMHGDHLDRSRALHLKENPAPLFTRRPPMLLWPAPPQVPHA